MDPRRLRIALPIALLAAFACSTVHLPQDAPLTEVTLGEAIETLRNSDGRVELLEDGIVVDLFVYEWRRVEISDWHDRQGLRRAADFGTETQYQRQLVGPKRHVYLPYESILAVQARSWVLWSGVELQLDGEFQLRGPALAEAPFGRAGDVMPVVIRARDEQDAQALSEAIDRVRRARQPSAEPASEPAEEGAPAEPSEPDAVAR